MGNCLCIYRTSTDAQEVETQKNEVIGMAMADGYTNDEIICIGCAGASAIKLNKKYIEQMESIYKTIDSEAIECVYAWAIDRIGRSEEILMQFKNKLIKNKIQLVIKNPSLRLLNDDGSKNTGVELAFSLFATMAKQEMEQKMERFERGKKRNMAEMKTTGAALPIGYSKDSKGFIIIDEEKADLVRLIFRLFNTGKFSTNTLAKELNSRGYRSQKGNEFNCFSISKIIKNKSYTGSYVDEKGRIHNFPQIISEEEFNKVEPILQRNNIKQVKITKHHYFAIKLLTCNCGYNYVATRTTYTCAGRLLGKRVGYKHLCNCDNNLNISFNNLDGILWQLTKEFMIDEIENDSSKFEKETKEQLDIINKKIEVLEKKLSLYDKKIEEIVERADIELRSEAFISKRIAAVNKQKEIEQKQLVRLTEERIRLEYNVSFSSSFQKWFTGYNSISEVELEGDEKVMHDLVHRYISKIALERINYKGSNQYYKIDITTHKGVYTVFYFRKNGLLDRTFIREPDTDYENQFKFERIIRNGNKLTTESNERFRKFVALFDEELSKVADFKDIWDVLLVEEDNDTELRKQYLMVSNDNNQRVIQFLNDRAIKDLEKKGHDRKAIEKKWKYGSLEFAAFYTMYKRKKQ